MVKPAKPESATISLQRLSLDEKAPKTSMCRTPKNLVIIPGSTEEGEHLAPLYIYTRKTTLPAEEEIVRYDYMMYHMCQLIDDSNFTYYDPSIPEETEEQLSLEEQEPPVETAQAESIDDELYVKQDIQEMGEPTEDGSVHRNKPSRSRRRRMRKGKIPLEQQEPPVETVQAESIDDDLKTENYISDMGEPTEDGFIACYLPSIPEETEEQLFLKEQEPPVETTKTESIDDDKYIKPDIQEMAEPTEDGSIPCNQPSRKRSRRMRRRRQGKLPLEEQEPPVETVQAESTDDDLGDKYAINDITTIINENTDYANACDQPSIPEEHENSIAVEKSEAKPQTKPKCRLFRWLFSKTSKVNTDLKSERRKKPKKGSLRGSFKKLFCCG